MKDKTIKSQHKRRKLRNSLANAPLLSKGGVHEKSRKAKRTEAKRELRSQVMSRNDSSPFAQTFISPHLAVL